MEKGQISSPQYDKALIKRIGEDVFISVHAEIRRPHLVSIGSHVAIDTGAYITTAAEIGDYVHIGPYTTFIGGESGFFKIGNFSGIAAGCRIICASDDYLGAGLIGPTIPKKYQVIIAKPVILEDFVTLGVNAIVMPGITLGEGSVVGAGSLVTKDTEPWTVYAGSPARGIKKRPSEQILAYAKELGYR